jgi:RNA polymerase sigma-70 factor (ECF subfamily)
LRSVPFGPTPPAPDPLAPLLKGAAAGDREDGDRLLAAVAPAVVAVTRVLLGAGHPELEDVAQESLAAIHQATARFRGESSFLHYARRIAVRTALARRRAAPPDQPTDPATFEDREGEGTLDADAMARRRRTEALGGLLDELPEGQAETLALRVVLGHSLDEVAAATGVPVNTVRSRIRLAKEHLRSRIAGDPALAALFDVAEGER